MNLRRRDILASSAAAVGALALTRPSRVFAQQSEPIRLGVVASLSGAQQLNGEPILIGARVAVERINRAGGINGRQLELVAIDDRADPNLSVGAVRELDGKGVNMIFGMSITTCAAAVASVINQLNCVCMVHAPDERLSHELYQPRMFMGATNVYSRNRALAREMTRRFPKLTRWGATIPDIAIGHGSWARFSKGLKEFYPQLAQHDVTLLEPAVSKFGSTDFKPQIAKLLSQEPEGLFNVVFGADGVTLFQQASQLGIIPKLSAIADQGFDIVLGKSLGKLTPPVSWTLSFWQPAAYKDVPEAEQLRAGYEAATKDPFPTGIAAFGFTSVQAYATAIRSAGSTKTDDIVAALENVDIKTVKGTVKFRKEDHQILDDVIIANVAPADVEPFWRIADIAKIPSSLVVNPPTPGKAMVE